MSSHTNTLIYNPSLHIYIYICKEELYSNQKTEKAAFVFNIGYNLLNLSLGLFQTCSHSLTDFDDMYPYQIALAIK